MSPSQINEIDEGNGVYYVTQEAAFCPGIAGGPDGWPDVIQHPTNKNARLVKRIAIRLMDDSDQPKQEFGPGAGSMYTDEHGRRVAHPHPNDDIHRQLSTDPLRPQVPVRLSNAPAASEPGEFDMNLPKVPGG